MYIHLFPSLFLSVHMPCLMATEMERQAGQIESKIDWESTENLESNARATNQETAG